MLNSLHRQRGISMIELMVAMSASILLMLGLATFMSGTLSSNSTAIKMSRFDQEARAAMTLMVREIRRAGYWGSPNYTTGALSGVGYGSTYVNPFANLDTATAGCILYRYDKNSNGLLDSGEYFGFQISNNDIQMLNNGSSTSNCNSTSGWSPLTSNANVKVTNLDFAETDSAPVYINGGSSGPNIKMY